MLLTSPLSSPLKNPVRDVFSPAGGSSSLTAPAGFDYISPINIFQPSPGVFTTDYNANAWKVPATVDYYVSQSGNDANPGRIDSPVRSIYQAMVLANANPATDFNIYINSGIYEFGNGFYLYGCTKNCNFIAIGGRALITNKYLLPSWTADGAGTYRVTRDGIEDVRDARYPVVQPNGESIPALLPKAADLAACQATAGTWWTDGTTVWVHLIDGRLPDAGLTGDVGCIYGTGSVLINSAVKHFYSGLDFEGGNPRCILVQCPSSGVTIPQVVIDDCTFRFQKGYLGAAVRLQGVATAIINNCRAFNCEGDGFSYSQQDITSPSTNAVEINCRAYNMGYAATNTAIQNGSTQHADGRIIRVNSQYQYTYGPVVADIGSTQTWALGVSALDCMLTSADSQDSCFQSGDVGGDTAKMWLDSCMQGGSNYGLWASAGCQIRYRNMTPGSIGGAGSVATY